MGLDLAQALLGSAFAGETLSGVGSSNVTEEVWAGVDQEPDPAETGRRLQSDLSPPKADRSGFGAVI